MGIKRFVTFFILFWAAFSKKTSVSIIHFLTLFRKLKITHSTEKIAHEQFLIFANCHNINYLSPISPNFELLWLRRRNTGMNGIFIHLTLKDTKNNPMFNIYSLKDFKLSANPVILLHIRANRENNFFLSLEFLSNYSYFENRSRTTIWNSQNKNEIHNNDSIYKYDFRYESNYIQRFPIIRGLDLHRPVPEISYHREVSFKWQETYRDKCSRYEYSKKNFETGIWLLRNATEFNFLWTGLNCNIFT